MLTLPPVALRVSSIALRVTAPGHRAPAARPRNGGKAPASKLLRAVDPQSKRGRVLAFLLKGASVRDVMDQFNMTRPAFRSTLTALRKDHGVGYALDKASGAIVMKLPKGELWR